MSQTSEKAASEKTGAAPAVVCTGIDHVVLYVRDLVRSVDFYTAVLGMEVRSQSSGHAFLRCGDQLFGLFAADGDRDMGRNPDGSYQVSHVAFSVATGAREEIKDALAARGVTIHGRRGDPDCIYFDDPDGYSIQIVSPEA